MRQMIDVALNAVMSGGKEVGEDAAIAGGDFGMAESTYQHQRQLVLNANGDYKQFVDACVGAVNFLDDEGPQGIVRKIAQSFLDDGMEVDNLTPNTAALSSSTVAPFIGAFYK